jgi:hypothetical protein
LGFRLGGVVADAEADELVDVWQTFFPVVGVSLEHGLHAGLERLDLPRPGADHLLCALRGAVGHDIEVVVVDQEREVRVRALEIDVQHMVAVDLYVGNWVHHRLGGRAHLGIAHSIDGPGRILGGECLTVVKLHTLAQLEGPARGVRIGLP